jgi:hypothetical protein
LRRPCPLALMALAVLFMHGCAAIRPDAPPPGPAEVQALRETLLRQGEAVESFYSLGSVVLRKWIVESEEARILVVGVRNPLRIKVEITHGWGAPVLHILVDRERLEAFSFPDEVLYTGPATAETLGRFLPCPPDMDGIWALLRGYPALPGAGVARPGPGSKIICDRGCSGSPWTLEVDTALTPLRLTFTESGLDVIFTDMEEREGIAYAGKVEVRPGKGPGKVLIRNERMVFNRRIPEKIFEVKKPPSYKRIELGQEAP